MEDGSAALAERIEKFKRTAKAEGCIICENEGRHDTAERPHVFAE